MTPSAWMTLNQWKVLIKTVEEEVSVFKVVCSSLCKEQEIWEVVWPVCLCEWRMRWNWTSTRHLFLSTLGRQDRVLHYITFLFHPARLVLVFSCAQFSIKWDIKRIRFEDVILPSGNFQDSAELTTCLNHLAAALMSSSDAVCITSMWSKIWTEAQNSEEGRASRTAWQQQS